MPVSVIKRKKCNNSQHSKFQQSLITLGSQNFYHGKENHSPTPKTRTQNKLHQILNQQKPTTPFTNRTVNNKEILSLINQTTNRLKQPSMMSHHSVGQRDAINIKINQMLENSVLHRVEGYTSHTSQDGDTVKFSNLTKLNILEREKLELNNIIKSKDDTIMKLESNVDSLNSQLQDQRLQLDSFQSIEEQVTELDKYCNELLKLNNHLKLKLAQSSEDHSQSLIKDMFSKCKMLEHNLQQLSSTFSKCNKLTIMLQHHEELPMEMFIRHKKDVQQTQESNLLSPVDNPVTMIEYHQKIYDIIQIANYTSQQMLKKGQKTLQQISQKFITNISDSYNQTYQY